MIFWARLLKIKPFSSPVTMRCKNDFLSYRASKMSRVFALFLLLVVQRGVVPIYRPSETFPSLVIDWKQLVDQHSITRRVVFVFANHLRPTKLAIPQLRIF